MNATVYSVARLDVAAPSVLTWVTVPWPARGR
jgi:hypothetical protein